MSFSFSVRATSKAEAVAKVDEELRKVVASQPVHAADAHAANVTAAALIGLLREPGEGETAFVNMSGSLSWQSEGVFTGANVSASTWIAKS